MTDGRPRRATDLLWVLVRLFLVVLLGAAAGVGVVLAVAALSSQPLAFLPPGAGAFAGVVWMGVTRVTGRSARLRRLRRLRPWIVAGIVGSLVLAVSVPFVPGARPAEAGPGQRFWSLSTGSRLAYVHVPARGRHRPTPVVFVHGGPATPDLAGDARYFGRLAASGFDVYVYAEVGSGRSSRLTHPSDYTLARDVADLDAVRTAIGARRMLLVGHSYGGAVVAGYLARHPERVSRAVFSSPGPLSPDDTSGGLLGGRVRGWDRWRLYLELANPRTELAFALLQVDPDAARAFAGDREMDARFDRVYDATRTALRCHDRPPPPPLHGLGFYAHQTRDSATAGRARDPRTVTPRVGTPALVIKGSCDYLSWSSAVAYHRWLTHSSLVYLHGAGHNAYQDRPDAYLAVVRAFLAGEPAPVSPVRTTRKPADYEGPP